MMNREQLGQLLSAYLDGELTADERAAAEELLARDAKARSELAALRETASLVGSLPRRAAPADLLDELHARFERTELLGEPGEAPPPVRSVRNLFRPLLAAAAMLVVAIGGGMWVMSRIGESQDTQPVAMSRDAAKDELPVAPEERSFAPPHPAEAPPGSVDRRTALDAEVVPEAARARRDVEPDSGDFDAPVSPSAVPTAPPATARLDSLGYVSADRGAKLVETASFDQKLKAGLGGDSLTHHLFSNESNNLVVIVPDENDAVLAKTQVVQFAVANGYTEVGASNQEIPTGRRDRLIMEGSRAYNYHDSNETQILVQMPEEEFPAFVNTISNGADGKRALVMNFGQIVFQDVDDAVRQLQQPPLEVAARMAEAVVLKETVEEEESLDSYAMRFRGGRESVSVAGQAEADKESPVPLRPEIDSGVYGADRADEKKSDTIIGVIFDQVRRQISPSSGERTAGTTSGTEEPGTLLERNINSLRAKGLEKSSGEAAAARSDAPSDDKLITLVVRIRQASPEAMGVEAGLPLPATSQPESSGP